MRRGRERRRRYPLIDPRRREPIGRTTQWCLNQLHKAAEGHTKHARWLERMLSTVGPCDEAVREYLGDEIIRVQQKAAWLHVKAREQRE